MNVTTKRYRIVSLSLAAIVVIVLSYLSSYAGRFQVHHVIDPGSTAFSVLDDEVMSLTYITPQYKLSAKRSKPKEAFAVQITFASGRKSQQCQVSPDLAGQLATFTTITVKRQIPVQRVEADFPILLGTIEIEDRIVSESPISLAFRASRDRSTVAVSYEGNAVVVDTPVAAFAMFEAGCEALAQ